MDRLVINCIDNPDSINRPNLEYKSIDVNHVLSLNMDSEFGNGEVLLGDISRTIDQCETLENKYGNGMSTLTSSAILKLEDSDDQDISLKENGGPTVVTDEEIKKANNINNVTNQRYVYPINTDNMEVIVDLNSDKNLHKTNALESIRSFDLGTGDDLEKISQISLSTGSISDTGSSNESVTSSSTSNYKDRGSVEKDLAREKMYSDMLLQCEQNLQEIGQLRSVIDRLQSERAHLEVEASHSVCRSQLEQQRREIELFRQEQELDRRTQATLKLEFESLKKQYEIANKEREASVMRYAVNEMEVINQRKERESLEKKYNESQKEKEGLSSKFKTIMIEKNRISQLLDSKCSQLANAQRDVEKLKEELNSRDIKIKWTQNKLKSEMELHKESEAQVQRLTGKVLEAKEEIEKAKRDAESAIKQFQFSQENKAHVLEQQLKEQQAQLILERHSLEDKEGNNKQLIHELNTLRDKQLLLSDENNALKLKVASLEKEKQENGQTVNRLQEELERRTGQVGELREQTSTMDSLRLQLQQAREDLASLQAEASALRTTNAELLSDMASCREREAEMLEFTQKVTSKNVRLQNEYSCIEAKARQLQCEEEPLHRQISELTKRVETFEKELNKERAERADEKKVVARHLAEKTARVETLVRELDDLKGENHVMKQKHTITLRELNREVAGYRKRLEQFENSSGSDLCQGSRTSSCTSLNETTHAPPTVTANTQMEPDKQAMVNRILRLQRDGVRLREKIEFLEEHGRTLVAELQKKTRLLQSYLLREQAGTLTSGSVDAHKAELARHGGIMASMYTSKPVDDSMTLELSLEINRKLQAVLEDTLLKNITLKENIDTLGDEIRRLSKKS